MNPKTVARVVKTFIVGCVQLNGLIESDTFSLRSEALYTDSDSGMGRVVLY